MPDCWCERGPGDPMIAESKLHPECPIHGSDRDEYLEKRAPLEREIAELRELHNRAKSAMDALDAAEVLRLFGVYVGCRVRSEIGEWEVSSIVSYGRRIDGRFKPNVCGRKIRKNGTPAANVTYVHSVWKVVTPTAPGPTPATDPAQNTAEKPGANS